MTTDYIAINTLVLVDEVGHAESIAEHLRNTGVAVQQSWVSTPADFSLSLQRDAFGMGILYIEDGAIDVPASILRYPDTPFLAVMDRFRNRTAEELMEYGLSDVVGLSHPIRLKQVLRRLLNEARIRQENRLLVLENESRSSMLQTLLQTTAEPVAFVHQGVHSYGNSAYRNLMGFPSTASLEQTPLLDIVAGDDRDVIAHRLNELENKSSGMVSIDTRLIDRSGSEIPVRLQFTRSWYDSESALQMIVCLQEEPDPIALLDAFEGGETIVIDPLDVGKGPSTQTPHDNQLIEDETDFDDTLLISTIAVTPDLTASLPVKTHDLQAATRLIPPSARIPKPTQAIDLALHSNSITCLRSDGSERMTLGTQSASQDQDTNIDPAALDSWLLDQAIDHAHGYPDTGIFVHTSSAIGALKAVIESFQPRLEYRQVTRRAITLIISSVTDGALYPAQFSASRQAPEWREIIRIAHLAGFGVCLRCPIPEDGFSGTFASSANAGIDYVMFQRADRSDLARSPEIAEQSTLLKQCQQRSIRSIAEIESDQSISKAWALGFDCFIIQPQLC